MTATKWRPFTANSLSLETSVSFRHRWYISYRIHFCFGSHYNMHARCDWYLKFYDFYRIQLWSRSSISSLWNLRSFIKYNVSIQVRFVKMMSCDAVLTRREPIILNLLFRYLIISFQKLPTTLNYVDIADINSLKEYAEESLMKLGDSVFCSHELGYCTFGTPKLWF